MSLNQRLAVKNRILSLISVCYQWRTWILGYFVSLIDISERKKAEAAVKWSEEKFEIHVGNMYRRVQYYMRYDSGLQPGSRYLKPMRSEAITGIPVKEFIGKTNREVAGCRSILAV